MGSQLKFILSPEDKRFMYFTLKKLISVVIPSSAPLKQRKDLVRLTLKFPPGKRAVYLQDWERQVIVHWLLKLHKLAEVRLDVQLQEQFKRIIEVLK